MRSGFRYAFDFDNDGRWDLGDGVTYAGGFANPIVDIHANYLRDSGQHTIVARIFDKDGAYATYHGSILVVNTAPKATFSGDTVVNEGQTALVKFSNSYDPSTKDFQAGFRYSYDFNDDGIYEIGDGQSYANSVTAPQARVPASFLDEGPSRKLIRARIFDRDGGFTEYKTAIRVANVAPTATFAIAGRVVPGRKVSLLFTGMTDPSPSDRLAGFRYAFDFDNDGQFDVVQRSPLFERVWSQPGSYTVRGRILDKDGGFRDYTTSVMIPALSVMSPEGVI
jgi:large repetitive protein